MISTTPTFRLFFFTFCLLIFDFCCAHPSPYSHTSTVLSRLEDRGLTSPVTLTTTEKIITDIGIFIQTCTITLTPIVVQGTDKVREDKTCTVTPDDGDSSALPPPATSTSSSDPFFSTSDVIPPSSTSTLPPAGGMPLSSTDGFSIVSPPVNTGVPSDTVLPGSTTTDSPPASSGSALPPVISLTLTLAPPPDVTSSMSSPPSSTSITSQPDNTDLPDVTLPPSSTVPLLQSSSSSTPTASPTAGAENAGAAAAPFDPPGKKLEVLPIGLGVFAGVSVIALVVVGIVTYERTKHRRNFRKLQEEENNRMRNGIA